MAAYKNQFKIYSEAGNIDIDQQTNAITFINKGSSAATINEQLTLSQDESLVIAGNVNEIDKTLYSVWFDLADTDRNLIVITKVYCS